MRRYMGTLSSLVLLLCLAGCGSWNTKDDAELPDKSIVAFRRSHDVNAVGQDVSSTVIARCIPGLPCEVIDYNSGYERGIGGAVFQGTGPAAALALGNWAAASSLRPPQYNSTTTMSNGTGSTFAGGAGGIGQGGIGNGGAGGLGGQGGSNRFAPGSVQGGNASANNGGMRFNASNSNSQQQGQSQMQHQAQQSTNINTNTANGYGGNANANATAAPLQGFTPTGPQQPLTFQIGGHTYTCPAGGGYCPDP